jgi:plastocyanin
MKTAEGSSSMRHRIVALCLASAIGALVLALSLDGSAQTGGTGTLTGHVTVSRGGHAETDRSQVIVYVEVPRSAATPRPAPATNPAIHQSDLRFTPDLVAIPRGGTVDFPNDDRVFHNVFSLSRTKRFDLGLYRAGESHPVTFDRPGVVDVYCNIHPDMIAQVFVLDTPYFAVTTVDGGFIIPEVPVGTWDVVARQRWGEAARGQVTITRGGSISHDVQVVAGERAQTHTRRDGTPYGRYR